MLGIVGLLLAHDLPSMIVVGVRGKDVTVDLVSGTGLPVRRLITSPLNLREGTDVGTQIHNQFARYSMAVAVDERKNRIAKLNILGSREMKEFATRTPQGNWLDLSAELVTVDWRGRTVNRTRFHLPSSGDLYLGIDKGVSCLVRHLEENQFAFYSSGAWTKKKLAALPLGFRQRYFSNRTKRALTYFRKKFGASFRSIEAIDRGQEWIDCQFPGEPGLGFSVATSKGPTGSELAYNSTTSLSSMARRPRS